MIDPGASSDVLHREIQRLQMENAALAARLAKLTRRRSHWYRTAPALIAGMILFGLAFWGFWQASHFEIINAVGPC